MSAKPCRDDPGTAAQPGIFQLSAMLAIFATLPDGQSRHRKRLRAQIKALAAPTHHLAPSLGAASHSQE